MILLTTNAQTLELVTSSASSTDYHVSWTDITTTTFTPGSTQGNIASATTTTILAAPASSTQRQVKMITVANKGTLSLTVTLQKDVSATDYEILCSATLGLDESLQYIEKTGFVLIDAVGNSRVLNPINTGSEQRNIEIYKFGTTIESSSVMYSFAKDSGYPGAWTVGSPGVAGRVTDGMTTTDAGCFPLWTPKGSLYLVGLEFSSTNSLQLYLQDWLWVNSGIAVTTTTSQTINSVQLPARDLLGGTAGVGVIPAILVTTDTTNGSPVTNTTLTYTNSDGVGSRTATIASFPTTCRAGSVVPFTLQVGDTGVRTIESITLGTSYGGGAISLIMYTNIASSNLAVVGGGGLSPDFQQINPAGIKLYNGACLFPAVICTGILTIYASIIVTDRYQ